MTKNQKIGTTIGTIVGVIALAFVVQWARFASFVKSSNLVAGSGTILVIPNNYFPFQGSYTKIADGKVVKA